MEKSWMQIKNRSSPSYTGGVHEFIRFAVSHMDKGQKKIRCPCYKCNNCEHRLIDDVEDHLLIYGIARSYSPWKYHGEDFEGDNDDRVDISSDSEQDEGDGREPNNSFKMLHDIQMGTLINDDLGETSCQVPKQKSVMQNAFARLFEDAKENLYPGCHKVSKLSFTVKLLHLKLLNRWSNKSFTMLLEFLKDIVPPGTYIPTSYYEAKKIIRDLGLGYEKIHVCKNDCILFWRCHKDKQMCPRCRESRWKLDEKRGKKVPRKVLRYFPLAPRLQRLYMSEEIAIDMRWHKDKRVNDGVLRHPADSEAWKSFDLQHELFANDPRNVRLGLASDGFNPFDNLSNPYSMWPVLLCPYNLPPWRCMKDSFFMMSMLIPGPTAPGNNIDVFLQPLIHELRELWEVGVQTYDSSKDQTFQLRAAVLWTINDFPAYGNLSGWSTKGKLACPVCNSETSYQYLSNGKKTCYMGHRRFLEEGHKWRRSKWCDGKETRSRPKVLNGDQVLEQLTNFEQPIFGKPLDDSNGGKKRKRTSAIYLNWTKKSIFFELPYWKTLKIRHILDVMHIEKNICDSILGTLMNIEGKTKDTYNARLDLEAMGIMHELHPTHIDGKKFLPHACYTLSKDDKKSFCEFLSSVKLPDGYASNISRYVNTQNCRIFGMKSHDCHVLLQRLLPVAIRGYLRKDVRAVLIELCLFFKELTSKTLKMEVLGNLEKNIIVILCKLEKLFPPAFFDIMVHLPIHLAQEAMMAGPTQFRWMYPFERYMRTLKGYVRNMARPEGSIAEGYIDNECMTFCSMYLHDTESKFNRPERNYGVDHRRKTKGLSVFSQDSRGLGRSIDSKLNSKDFAKTRWYVLNNCGEVSPYLLMHKEELRRQGIGDIELRHELDFPRWFLHHVAYLDVLDDIINLARGPDERVVYYSGCIINGLRFHTEERDKDRKTHNNGIVVKGQHNEQDIYFYGILTDIIELSYIGNNKVLLFKCKWWDIGKTGTRIRKDEYGYVSINVNKTWYAEDPFILASQAEQVFYLSDTKLVGDWKVVERIQPRNIYDIHEEKNDEVEDEPYQQEEAVELVLNIENDDDILELNVNDAVDIAVHKENEDSDDSFLDVNDIEYQDLVDEDNDEDVSYF